MLGRQGAHIRCMRFLYRVAVGPSYIPEKSGTEVDPGENRQ